MKDLESRLRNISTDEFKDKLISHLASRGYEKAASRSNPYYKYELIPSITNLINQYAPVEHGFEKNLNSAINKEEAKRIYYGLVCMGNPEEYLKQILVNLTDWEKIYFFAGVWKNRKMKGIRSKNLPEIVQDHIKSGIDFLHKSHMIKKAEGTYVRKLKLPQSQDYYKELPGLKQIALDFKQLLDKEDGTYETEERTAIFLDSCSNNELKYLTKRFGHEKLCGYAVE